jgi:hypothetical protein
MTSKKNQKKLLIKKNKISHFLNKPNIPKEENKEMSFNFKYIDPSQSTCHNKLEVSKQLSKYWNLLQAYS